MSIVKTVFRVHFGYGLGSRARVITVAFSALNVLFLLIVRFFKNCPGFLNQLVGAFGAMMDLPIESNIRIFLRSLSYSRQPPDIES